MCARKYSLTVREKISIKMSLVLVEEEISIQLILVQYID